MMQAVTLRWRQGLVRAGVAMVVVAGALSAPAAAAGVAGSIGLSEGGGATFPARALVLSVPHTGALRSSQVHISEDGKPVSGAVVRPIADAGAGDFGVVLAIDVSPSMRGAPLARAMAAARGLAAQRTGMQELGVVTFDRHATVALPLTDDPRAIAAALARSPSVGSGAYIYNAMTVAVRQLANAKIAAGAVILLSDGASEGARPLPGNRVTASAIGAAATAAHAQIYTVGLRDASYTPQRMSLLARAGGGAFIESSSSQLAGVFKQIEAGLTSRFVVHYRSPAPLGQRIAVAVKVDGFAQKAMLSYTAPPAPAKPAPQRATHSSFWLSTLALVLASGVAGLLLGVALLAAVVPRLRRSGLRRRVGEFTASVSPEAPRGAPASTSHTLLALERLLKRTGWWANFETNVEIAGIEHSPVELVASCALTTLAVAVVAGFALGTPVLSVIVLLLGPFALASIVNRRLAKQRDLFAEQLPSSLQEIASTMRAGHSLIAGVGSMAESADEPSRGEWTRVIADEQLGMPLEDAMRPLATRMGSEDIGQVALVAALHTRTGGNMAEVLERVADSVRERAELRRELRALTAQARLSRYVVTSLPIVVAGAIALINPHYIRPLFHTTAGVVLVFVAGALLIAASLVMRSITDVKA
jgi:Flp pilus assembly protein TadB